MLAPESKIAKLLKNGHNQTDQRHTDFKYYMRTCYQFSVVLPLRIQVTFCRKIVSLFFHKFLSFHPAKIINNWVSNTRFKG